MPERPEDDPHTLLFVDILGFAALTKRHPTRIVDSGPDEHGFTGSGTSPLQTCVVRFQSVIDAILREESLYGGASAMIFSDCAYFDFGNAFRTAVVASGLMRLFIRAEVPVRMGIGRGTFYGFKYSTESDGQHLITKSLFAGTAVIFAHEAEQCGEKGCRIFLHPTAEDSLDAIRSQIPVLSLPSSVKNARYELSYLPHPLMLKEMDFVHDDDLIEHIQAMAATSEPASPEVQFQYSETLRLLDAMRAAHGRLPKLTSNDSAPR